MCFCFAAMENTNHRRNMTPVFCSLMHLQFGRLSLCVAVLGEENILASWVCVHAEGWAWWCAWGHAGLASGWSLSSAFGHPASQYVSLFWCSALLIRIWPWFAFRAASNMFSIVGNSIQALNIPLCRELWFKCCKILHFYPRDAMLAGGIVIATCLSVRLSVRPSVRLSRAGIVSKRRKLAALFLHHLVAPRL